MTIEIKHIVETTDGEVTRNEYEIYSVPTATRLDRSGSGTGGTGTGIIVADYPDAPHYLGSLTPKELLELKEELNKLKI